MSHNAGQKVFSSPDLIEKLLPFLDPTSTLRLAESNISSVLQILQEGSVVWNNLVKRTLPGDHKIDYDRSRYFCGDREYWTRVNEALLEKRVQILILINILKRMNDANSDKLHHVLNVICEKSPPDGQHMPSIQISCACHGSKSVSPLGFLLLEEVEAGLGLTLQEVEMIGCPPFQYLEECLLTALASRLSRQQKKVTRMEVRWLKVSTLDSAWALLTLMQNTEAGSRWSLRVSGNIQAEGWAAVAKALSSASARVGSVRVASKVLMKEGRKEDLRSSWESLLEWWAVGNKYFSKTGGEESWRALEQLIDET